MTAAAPHLGLDPTAPDSGSALPATPGPRVRAPKVWLPKRVLVTPAAYEHAHGRAMAARCEALGCDVTLLAANRITGLRGKDERETYAIAKSTLAVVVSPPGKRKLQPIPPSADWQFHLAEGCPAHCQYCYLAGSLTGPPVTRVYANLEEILAGLPAYEGQRTLAREHEGTTFEASCYTDPLGIEHLSGSLAETISWFGQRDASTLRFTTKFDAVEPLLPLGHGGRTRIRFSVNAAPVTRFEGGTAALPERLGALRQVALAGYKVGLTIAPIMPGPDWQDRYGELLDGAAAALDGVPEVDLTVECITHRFTAGSKAVLTGWYPKTKLDMDESARSPKRNKFGGTKFVYPKGTMGELRGWFDRELAARLPQARVLYWT